MDHGFIDRNAIAERYLDHALTPADRSEFETHLVDCAECRDRLLLAEMFHARNGRAAVVDIEPVIAVPYTEFPESAVHRALPRRWIALAAAGIVLWLALLIALFAWFSRH